MATFLKVGRKTKALVRKQGTPTQSKTFTRLSDAKLWAKGVEAEIERGKFQKNLVLANYTVGQALELYRNSYASRGLRSIKFVASHSNQLRQALGHICVNELTSETLIKYRDTRLLEVSAATVKHELGVLKRSLNELITRLDVPSYQLPTAKPPSVSNARNRRVSDKELSLLHSQIKNVQIIRLINLAIETGMRRGELLAITHSDIKWDARALSIYKTKTNKPRVVPLSTTALEILAKQSQDLGPKDKLFHIAPDSVSHAFKRACVQCHINDLRFHDLRHEATSRFFEKGLSIMEVASITGHEDPRMLKRYTHFSITSLAHKLD